MTTVTGMPAAAAAYATAPAWLPADIVTMPRARSSAVIVSTRLTAPRDLNEPVTWRCSAFRKIARLVRRPGTRHRPGRSGMSGTTQADAVALGDPARRGPGVEQRRVGDPSVDPLRGRLDVRERQVPGVSVRGVIVHAASVGGGRRWLAVGVPTGGQAATRQARRSDRAASGDLAAQRVSRSAAGPSLVVVRAGRHRLTTRRDPVACVFAQTLRQYLRP